MNNFKEQHNLSCSFIPWHIGVTVQSPSSLHVVSVELCLGLEIQYFCPHMTLTVSPGENKFLIGSYVVPSSGGSVS